TDPLRRHSRHHHTAVRPCRPLIAVRRRDRSPARSVSTPTMSDLAGPYRKVLFVQAQYPSRGTAGVVRRIRSSRSVTRAGGWAGVSGALITGTRLGGDHEPGFRVARLGR